MPITAFNSFADGLKAVLDATGGSASANRLLLGYAIHKGVSMK